MTVAAQETQDATRDEASVEVHVIEARPGWRLFDFKEMWAYRDLLRFLTFRELKVRYAQSVLGVGWAVIQPVVTMVVFTLVFGRLAKVKSDGAPYAVFSYAAVVPWTYFSTALTDSSNSLIKGASMLGKIYFPRAIMPLTPVLARLIDFAIAMVIVAGLLAWYRIVPTAGLAVLPLLVAVMALTAAGLGMFLAALAVQYRDIQYGMSFGVQALMFASPVVYPASLVPEQFRLAYAINPMVGVIEGFRSAFLGTNPMPWGMIGVGAAASCVIVFAGAMYFRRTERLFADVA